MFHFVTLPPPFICGDGEIRGGEKVSSPSLQPQFTSESATLGWLSRGAGSGCRCPSGYGGENESRLRTLRPTPLRDTPPIAGGSPPTAPAPRPAKAHACVRS